MNHAPQPNDADRETLLAYLDGELDAAARRRLEDRLVVEKPLRDELTLLQRCGDALAELEPAPADADFLRSTMTIVALRAVEEAQQTVALAPVRNRRRWAAYGAAVLVVAAAGFAVVRALSGDPARRLAADLPVLERLDEWRLVGSISRLAAIHEAEIFADESDSTPMAEESGPVTVVSFDLLHLSRDQEDELLRRRQRLELLTADERASLLALAMQAAEAPQAGAMLSTLERYFDWAAAELSPAELDELRKTPALETPARIRELMAEHAERRRTMLSPEDQRAVARWFEQTVRKLAPNVKPPSNELQRRAELRRWLERNRTGGAARFFQRVTAEDLEALVASLSDETGKRLAGLPRPQTARVIGPWIQAALREPGSAVGEEEMTAFFEKLPGEERERLMRLSAEEMQQQLRRAYWRDKLGDQQPPPEPPADSDPPRARRPRGKPPGRVPGGEGPPRRPPRDGAGPRPP